MPKIKEIGRIELTRGTGHELVAEDIGFICGSWSHRLWDLDDVAIGQPVDIVVTRAPHKGRSYTITRFDWAYGIAWVRDPDAARWNGLAADGKSLRPHINTAISLTGAASDFLSTLLPNDLKYGDDPIYFHLEY